MEGVDGACNRRRKRINLRFVPATTVRGTGDGIDHEIVYSHEFEINARRTRRIRERAAAGTGESCRDSFLYQFC